MRNILVTTMAAGLCALTLSAPAAGAEDQRKLDNLGRLDWLELRTLVAGTDGPVIESTKTGWPGSAKLGLPGSPGREGYGGLDFHKRDLGETWDLLRQQSAHAAKSVSKRTGEGRSGVASTAPELSWGWQHAS